MNQTSTSKTIKFKKLTLQNFLSYKSPQIFNFNGNGITLMLGLNGHGKSGISSALYYVLFGKSDRGSIDELVNNEALKNCKVTLELEINNENYKVIRGRKPNIFEVYKDNKLLNQNSTLKEQQKSFNELLGFSETIFFQLIYLGANISSTKNFLDLSQKEKEEILNILIDVSDFNIMRDKVKEFQKYLKNELSNKQSIITMLENDIIHINNSIEKQVKQNEEIIKNKNNLLNNITKEIESNENKIEIINTKLEKKTTVEEKLKEKDNTLEQEFNDKKERYSHLKYKKQLYEDNEKSKIICPKCGNEIKKELDFNLEDVINDMNILKDELIEIKNKINTKQGEIQKYQNALNKLNQIQFEKEHLQNLIKNLKERYKQIESMEEIKIDYTILDKKKKELKKVENEIIEYKNDLDDSNELLMLLSEDNLKGQYINKYIPMVNYYVNYYLEKLNSQFTIKFNTKFKETLYINNKEISYQSLSNGQKMRIIIAILFAFLKLIEMKSNINFNVLFLDEFINGSLDVNGVDDTLNSLKQFAENKEIILITHNNDIKQMDELFSRVFEIKKNGESKIIEL